MTTKKTTTKTTTKTTSIETWHDLLKAKALAPSRAAIVTALRQAGRPATAAELAKAAGDPKSGHKRLSELRRLGLVVEASTRECAVTGRKATTWQIAETFPALALGRGGRVAKVKAKAKKAAPVVAVDAAGDVVDAAIGFLCRALDVDEGKVAAYTGDAGPLDAVEVKLISVLNLAGLLEGEGYPRPLLPALKAKAEKADELRAELGATRELLRREKAKARTVPGVTLVP